MLRVASSRPPAFMPISRGRVVLQLELSWIAVVASSQYVQQLDDLVVKASVWGDSYATAQGLLDAAVGRLETWTSCGSGDFDWVPDAAFDYVLPRLRACQRHLARFEWSAAQGSLYDAGRQLLAIADQLGVEL